MLLFVFGSKTNENLFSDEKFLYFSSVASDLYQPQMVAKSSSMVSAEVGITLADKNNAIINAAKYCFRFIIQYLRGWWFVGRLYKHFFRFSRQNVGFESETID